VTLRCFSTAKGLLSWVGLCCGMCGLGVVGVLHILHHCSQVGSWQLLHWLGRMGECALVSMIPLDAAAANVLA
jgi:hypothetical protein